MQIMIGVSLAIFEVLLVSFNVVLSFLCLLLFGWWVPISDFFHELINDSSQLIQKVLFPLSLILLLFMPWYGLATASIVVLRKSLKRYPIILIDIKNNFRKIGAPKT